MKIRMSVVGLLGAVLLIALSSCRRDNRTELFELNYFIDFDVPPGLNTFDTHFFTVQPLASLYQAKLTAQGFTTADVVAIEGKDAHLGDIFNDANLKFIQSISVYIFDPFNPADKIEFFYLEPTPFRNTNSWRLFPGITDIRPWIEREYFGIEVRLNFRDVSPSFIPMRLEFDIRVMGE